MKCLTCLFSLLILLWSSVGSAKAEPLLFRTYLSTHLSSLDPLLISRTEILTYYNNLYRGLYRINAKGQLVVEGAIRCEWKNTKNLECELSPTHLWSNGQRVKAQEYVEAFRRFVSKDSKSLDVDLLLGLKNARAIHNGKMNAGKLGVTSHDPYHLRFQLEEPDSEFKYKLASPLLVPVVRPHSQDQLSSQIYNGPYVLKSWSSKALTLEPNPYFKKGHPRRPNVEILFIDEEAAVINLFDANKIHLIKRIPTIQIPKYKKQKIVFAQTVSRFDYLGFGPQLRFDNHLTEALIYSLDFKEFQNLFSSLGPPGCPSFSSQLLDKERCYKFNLKRAKKAYEQVSDEVKNRRYQFFFSSSGGEDLKRSAEWFQAQWKKHLGFEVDIGSMESGVYKAEVRDSPPDVFRMGFQMDRPTCLAALESFSSLSPNNFIEWKSAKFDHWLSEMAKTHNQNTKRKLCGQALNLLLESHRLVPLGQFQFFLALSPGFSGVYINNLNQIDLSLLHPVSK